MGDAGAGEGGCAAVAVRGVNGLVCFEFGEEGGEGAEVFEWGVGVEVEDGGDGETQEEVVCGAAGKFASVEPGEA